MKAALLIFFILAAGCLTLAAFYNARATNMAASLIAQGFDEINIPSEVENDQLALSNDNLEMQVSALQNGKNRKAVERKTMQDRAALAGDEQAEMRMEENHGAYLEQQALYDSLKLIATIGFWVGISFLTVAAAFLVLVRKRQHRELMAG